MRRILVETILAFNSAGSDLIYFEEVRIEAVGKRFDVRFLADIGLDSEGLPFGYRPHVPELYPRRLDTREEASQCYRDYVELAIWRQRKLGYFVLDRVERHAESPSSSLE